MIKAEKKSRFEDAENLEKRPDISAMEKQMENKAESFKNEIHDAEENVESDEPEEDKKSAKAQRRAEKERLKQEKKARWKEKQK